MAALGRVVQNPENHRNESGGGEINSCFSSDLYQESCHDKNQSQRHHARSERRAR